jgi:hypothetical protein
MAITRLNTNCLFEVDIADKKTNSVGLEIADLAACPIGVSILPQFIVHGLCSIVGAGKSASYLSFWA